VEYLYNFVVLFFTPDFILYLTRPSEQMMGAKKMEDKLSKVVEVFIGRIQKMENEFIRYKSRPWFLYKFNSLLFLLNSQPTS
jgi:hypothetical protein